MWRTGQEHDARQSAEKKRWCLLNLRGQGKAIITSIILLYLSLLAWPLYNLAIGAGSLSGNFTLLAGMLGLILAAYAAIADHVRVVVRLLLSSIGIAMIICFWGFEPL
jgi:hypothetical protein